MSNAMCALCLIVGEPYKKPACDRSDCPAHGLTRMLASLSARVVGHACKLNGSICESRPDRCSDCPAGVQGSLKESGRA